VKKVKMLLVIILLASVCLFAATTYDSNGNMLTRTDTNGNVECWTYDKDGNCLSYTDRFGNVTFY
jgi:hypothetical protein